MADLSKLVNELSNLTVLEAAELAKKLQARWDVQLKRRPVLSFNEGKVCDAIVRRLEEREQHPRVVNIAKLRTDRMQAAIDKKFPKLAAWKTNDSARTISNSQ